MKDDTTQRRPRPVWRWLHRGFCLVLFAWFAFVLVTRWDAEPVIAYDGKPSVAIRSQPIDPALDRTKTLKAVLARMPAAPPFVLPEPPDGMKWETTDVTTRKVDFSDVSSGPWTPETRPNLYNAIQQLESPAFAIFLDDIVAIKPGAVRAPVALSRLRHVAKMLAARARLKLVRRNDPAAAIDDIAGLYRLGTSIMRSTEALALLTGNALQALADSELRSLAFEFPLSKEDARKAMDVVQTASLDRDDMWRLVIAMHCDSLQQLLDRSYTNDGEGGGYLVLNHLDDVFQPSWSNPPRIGAWNALSIVFNDRRTVAAKIERYRETMRAVEVVAYAEAVHATGVLERQELAFTLLDGPVCSVRANKSAYHLRWIAHEAESRSATILSLAISAYRHDNGVFPNAIADLIPTYLEELPAEGPFLYRQTNFGSDFVLYTVGANRVDDGGAEPSNFVGVAPEDRDGDVIFRHDRGDPSWEIQLLPVIP